MKNVAVVLSGSGYQDGSEIREAVAVLWALSKHGADAKCFAPDGMQSAVVDHLTGKVVKGEKRNILHESARIARGEIQPLSNLDPASYDALVMPGGFGAATNLSSFAAKGALGDVNPELARVLESFYEDSQPIGVACIAPAVVALAFKGKRLELTVGAAGPEADEIQKLGHHHFVKLANEIHFDERHNIVSTPAYMYADARIDEVFEGIAKMVLKVLERIGLRR